MVQIAIKCKNKDGCLEEWALIELQGDICHRQGDHMPLNALHLGDLHFTKDGTPLLLIGHHVLYGKLSDVEKPYLVTKKSKTDQGTEYVVQAAVTKKIIFKTRPKPIVTNVPITH